MIPVSVIVATLNEEQRISACLSALKGFGEIIVVDSGSLDKTAQMARQAGALVVPFVWNKAYPKKRQWILDNVPTKFDWIFFVDADEIVTDDLKCEMKTLLEKGPDCAGYFVMGRYCSGRKILMRGIPNRKIALLDKTKMEFPLVDDLDIPGMGEIEGHYQPILKNEGEKIGSLKSFLIHDALDNEQAWGFRHEKYARWEAGMNGKRAWPLDPVPWREALKKYLRASKWRPEIMFLAAYILKLGFLDGRAGKNLALAKMRYYRRISEIEGRLKNS
jgi:glycosyltransferase involved in cell wall biosynthesis